ncbi:MAG: YlxR family protein [Dehalococcoidia bacterium]
MAPKPRHVPTRTCIGCRQHAGKRDLVRIVRTPTGDVRIDPTGRAPGRGAYIHSNRACWEKALKGATMNRTLKITLSTEDAAALHAYAEALPSGEETSNS